MRCALRAHAQTSSLVHVKERDLTQDPEHERPQKIYSVGVTPHPQTTYNTPTAFIHDPWAFPCQRIIEAPTQAVHPSNEVINLSMNLRRLKRTGALRAKETVSPGTAGGDGDSLRPCGRPLGASSGGRAGSPAEVPALQPHRRTRPAGPWLANATGANCF